MTLFSSARRVGVRTCFCGVVAVGVAAGCAQNRGGGIEPAPHYALAAVNLSPDRSSIAFDDGIYSAAQHCVLVPGADSGKLFFIDPDTLEVTSIDGFARPDAPRAGPRKGSLWPGSRGGITSIAEGRGFLYASDRTDKTLYVVDPARRRIVSIVALAGVPGHVRYVAVTDEVWITEPEDTHQIEIFSLTVNPRQPQPAGVVAVAGGPDGLYINQRRKVAYANGAAGQIVVINVRSRQAISTWASGCAEPKGMAMDEANGLSFVACGEGGVVSVDLNKDKMVSRIYTPGSTHSVGLSPTLRHLYVPGAGLLVAGVSSTGVLSLLGQLDPPAALTEHALADDSGHAWVLSPATGQALRISDSAAP